jgi:ankyrin repeat protein
MFDHNSVVREIVGKEKNTMSDGDEDSNTALHLAASGGHIKLVETLLSLGAEPEVRYVRMLGYYTARKYFLSSKVRKRKRCSF